MSRRRFKKPVGATDFSYDQSRFHDEQSQRRRKDVTREIAREQHNWNMVHEFANKIKDICRVEFKWTSEKERKFFFQSLYSHTNAFYCELLLSPVAMMILRFIVSRYAPTEDKACRLGLAFAGKMVIVVELGEWPKTLKSFAGAYSEEEKAKIRQRKKAQGLAFEGPVFPPEYSVRTISHALTELENAGLITREQHKVECRYVRKKGGRKQVTLSHIQATDILLRVVGFDPGLYTVPEKEYQTKPIKNKKYLKDRPVDYKVNLVEALENLRKPEPVKPVISNELDANLKSRSSLRDLEYRRKRAAHFWRERAGRRRIKEVRALAEEKAKQKAHKAEEVFQTFLEQNPEDKRRLERVLVAQDFGTFQFRGYVADDLKARLYEFLSAFELVFA